MLQALKLNSKKRKKFAFPKKKSFVGSTPGVSNLNWLGAAWNSRHWVRQCRFDYFYQDMKKCLANNIIVFGSVFFPKSVQQDCLDALFTCSLHFGCSKSNQEIPTWTIILISENIWDMVLTSFHHNGQKTRSIDPH